jgi:glycopeptide antibiotics resistance protein
MLICIHRRNLHTGSIGSIEITQIIYKTNKTFWNVQIFLTVLNTLKNILCFISFGICLYMVINHTSIGTLGGMGINI